MEVEEGEVVLLNNLLLHRSGVNPTGKQRRAFSAAYMDAADDNMSTTGETFPVIFGKNALKALRTVDPNLRVTQSSL